MVRILPLALPAPELAHDVSVRALAPQHVLIRDEPLEPNGPPRVDPPRADPDLRAKAIPEAVGKARARVDEHARRVDAAHERAARVSRLRHDAVRVVRAVRVDVRDGGCERWDAAHGERLREVLRRIGVRRRGRYVRREVGDSAAAGLQRGERWLVAEEPHVRRE